MINLNQEERELLRISLYTLGSELKTLYPKATAQEIRETLKSIIDVAI